MDEIILFEEYRLIERSESDVNGAWKGAHLLLFFLAFVFGSFCTFCFHMLMYLFDEKCVLFPKLLSLTTLRQNIIYEFIPEDKEIADMLPVDFLSTQWVEKSACYLPTYVPLVSGIFGLVWTTMFLMCSTGSRTLTGLQRPWRVLLPVFVFSVAMGGLCLYATIVTHNGLQELCLKLGEITGSSTCTYSVNVATLAYERRIRGVYQATRITILSAWLHTLCWILSALLTLMRVILVVDFQLVKVSVRLKGNIDKMLEHQEEQIGTVSPELWIDKEKSPKSPKSHRSHSSVKVHFQKREQTSRFVDTSSLNSTTSLEKRFDSDGHVLYNSAFLPTGSDPSLVNDERYKLDRFKAFNAVPKDKQFIVKMLYDLIDVIGLTYADLESRMSYLDSTIEETMSERKPLTRQYGQQEISPMSSEETISDVVLDSAKVDQLVLEIKRKLAENIHRRISESHGASTSKKAAESEALADIASEMKQASEERLETDSFVNRPLKRELSTSNIQQQILNTEQPKTKKSNLKSTKLQTVEVRPTPKVLMTDSKTSVLTDVDYGSERTSEGTNTNKPDKEKND